MKAGLTKEDHKVRSKGVGSSEIAMLLTDPEGNSLSPWGGPHKLWRRKMGLGIDTPTNKSIARGNYMEPALAQWWADDNGFRLEKPPTMAHPTHDYIVGSTDGLGFKPKAKVHSRTLEVKTAHWTQKDQWGEQGTDEVPMYYLVQCQWHEGIWPSLDRICDVVCDVSGERLDYFVPFDADLYGALVEEAQKFWVDHVLTGKAPPVDAEKETGQWLSKRIKQHEKERTLLATPEQYELLMSYREIRNRRDALSEPLQALENQIKDFMGDAQSVFIDGSSKKVTWKKTKDSTVVDWKGFVNAALDGLSDSERDAELGPYTKKKEGTRRFLPQALLKD